MSKNSQKKGSGPTKPVLLGRLGTSLKCGILGLPNVGKSSFFNIMCKCSIPAENYPFCTITPHLSKVAIPDERFDYLVEHWKPVSSVCGSLNVVDIAGLVKGAASGEGLGNNFLADIKGVDALFHMVRIFEDEEIVHVAGRINPIEDIEIINEELRLKDLEYVQNTHKRLESEAIRGNDKSKRAAFDCFVKLLDLLTNDKKAVRFYTWTPAEIEILNEHLLLTAKPIIYLLNLSKKDYLRKKNSWLPKVVAWVGENDPGAQIIPFSVDFESEVLDSNDEELLKNTAIPKIIKTGFKVLNLKYFFTAGKDEVKAWIIQEGYKAPKAAGRIHTDMEKGFIMAEVMKFEDFKEHGSEAACKAAGKYLQKGRDYEVQDGDIIFFKFNAPTTKKK